MKNKSSTEKIILKLIIFLLFFLINIYFLKFTFRTVIEETSWNTYSEITKRLDSQIAVGDYNELKTSLYLEKLYTEEYDSYYEIANGYNLLCDYKIWIMSPSNEDKAKETKEKLLELYQNSNFDKNKNVLKSFIDEML